MTNRNNQPTAVILTIDEGGGLMAEMELVYPTRFGKDKLRAQLIPLIRAGRVECVKVRHTRIDGATTYVPAYRVVKQ